jgi:hypothetical protein
MDTAAAIVKAVAASPATFGLPFSAFAAVTGAAQIAAIASQKFEGSVGNVTPPSLGSPPSGDGGSGSGGSGSGNTQTGDANTGVETNLNDLMNGNNAGQFGVSKVVLVETDVTKSIKNVQKIENIATL